MQIHTSLKQKIDEQLNSSILIEYFNRLNQTSTVEQRLALEQEALVKIEDIDKDIELEFIKRGQNFDISVFEFWKSIKEKILNYIYKSSLVLDSILVLDGQYKQKNEIYKSAINHINQRIAWLDYLTNGEFKFSIKENFNNNTYLDTVKENSISINNSIGVGTLPGIDTTIVTPEKVILGNLSNGRIGNSLETNISNNININALLIKDNYFEYELRNAGELVLEIEFSFKNEEVINCIDIYPYIKNTFASFTIKDILFSSSGSSVSIRELTPVDKFIINNDNDRYRLVFLPVKTKNISIIFTQFSRHENMSVPYANIALDYIEFNRITYDNKAILNSIDFTLALNCYLLEQDMYILPKNKDLYNLKSLITIDNKNSYQYNEPIVLEGTEQKVNYSLELSINTQALSSYNSFFDNESVQMIETVSKPFNHLLRPNKVLLPFEPNNIYAYHPNVLSISNSIETELRTVASGSNRIQLPVDLGRRDTDNIHLLVNGVEQTFVETGPAAGEWTFANNERFAELGILSELDNEITIRVDPEQCSFDYKNGYYIYKPLYDFDPDPDTLFIKFLSSEKVSTLITLPNDKTKIYLNVPYIYELKLFSSLGITYTEVFDKASLTSNTYYVNYKDGIIWLDDVFDTDFVRASVTAHKIVLLDKSNYTVHFENEKPVSIKIKADKIAAIEASDTFGEALGSITNLSTGLTMTRTNPLSGGNLKVKRLTYSNILPKSVFVSGLLSSTYGDPEEVPYKDGKSEFLGLVEITDEVTNETEPVANLASFYLSAGEYVYLSYGIYFSDTSVFVNKKGTVGGVTTLGDYHIAVDGLVTVYVGTTNLPANIKMNYFYKDPNYKPDNKFSVDYKEGVIYGGSNFQTGGTINYKTGQYTIEYDIVYPVFIKEINSSNRTISLISNRKNNIVKFAHESKINKNNLSDLASYFSPIIDYYGLRFY